MRELLIAQGNQISRSQLLSRHWGEFTDFDLDRIAETLASADAIEIRGQNKNTVYVMKKTALDMYTKAFRSIQ